MLWFGQQFLLERHCDYRDLVASLRHHFTNLASRARQYVVLPMFMLRCFEHWTDGPLCLVFVQLVDHVPHVRVAFDHDDLRY